MADTVVTPPEPTWAAFLALAWGSQKHAWILQPADGGKPEEGCVDNTPEAVATWAAGLLHRFNGQPVAVALEQKRGSVVNLLLPYPHLVLFPVPASMSASYRKTFVPSAPKTIRATPGGFRTCCSAIGTVSAASSPMTPTPACCCWSKTAGNSWMIRLA